jgi:hypothetical protein
MTVSTGSTPRAPATSLDQAHVTLFSAGARMGQTLATSATKIGNEDGIAACFLLVQLLFSHSFPLTWPAVTVRM